MRAFALLTLTATLFCSLSLNAQKTRETPAGEAPVTYTPASSYDESLIDLPDTEASFDKESHDFKKIKAGKKVSYTFRVKNTGSHPLKIYNVKPSCGCTTPDWTKEEIAPGAYGSITVEFDSAGKHGPQKKTVTVTMNTEPRTKVLNFSGEVVD